MSGQPAAPALPALEPLEIHSGMVFGECRTPPSDTPDLRAPSAPVEQVLEELILPALSRPPCMVAFSGGRDSSILLAVTTRLARSVGLADPIPLTFRYPDLPRTWETEWQEEVVRHLRLDDWEVLRIESEFDFLGPIGSSCLRRHGLYWPPNAHAILPLLHAAGSGALITGNGGDEVFSSLVRGRILRRVRAGMSLPLRQALSTVPISLLPFPWRVRIHARRRLRLPWLHAGARREVQRRFVADALKDRGGIHFLERFPTSRYLEVTRGTFGTLAKETAADLSEPFLEPRFFLAALAASPPEGFPNRGAGIAHFFPDLLPPAVLRRRTKAVFSEAFWGEASRKFAADWDGTGLDTALVDVGRLRNQWARPRPDFRSSTCLQAAWLATGRPESTVPRE